MAQSDQTRKVNLELRSIEDEIKIAEIKGHLDRVERMQHAYQELVYKGRNMTKDDMRDWVIEFLVEDTAGLYPVRAKNFDQYPSLMEVSNGKVEVAAEYVVMLMTWSANEPVPLNIARACQVAEQAAARFTNQNGEDRFSL